MVPHVDGRWVRIHDQTSRYVEKDDSIYLWLTVSAVEVMSIQPRPSI